MEILLVEDDAELVRQLVAELGADGHQVQVEVSGPQALDAVRSRDWDGVILDVTLPGLSGFEIVETLRAEAIQVPVLFLTALSDVSDRVRGLLLGGDDYLTKPFSMDELKARLRVVDRRRAQARREGLVLPKGWEWNPLLREVTVLGRTFALQPREWSLLELFVRHEGEVLSKAFLLHRAWGIRFDPGTNLVDAVVCRLRRKLDRPGAPSHVQTLRGRGYVFHRDV